MLAPGQLSSQKEKNRRGREVDFYMKIENSEFRSFVSLFSFFKTMFVSILFGVFSSEKNESSWNYNISQ